MVSFQSGWRMAWPHPLIRMGRIWSIPGKFLLVRPTPALCPTAAMRIAGAQPLPAN